MAAYLGQGLPCPYDEASYVMIPDPCHIINYPSINPLREAGNAPLLHQQLGNGDE
jgi:hypothetical protein